MEVNRLHPDGYAGSYMPQREFGLQTLSKVDLSRHNKILDIGCGEGTITARIAELVPAARVVGIDLSQDMISRCRRVHPSCEFYQADARNLALLNSDFDLVFTSACLHWIEEVVAVISAVTTITQPRGEFWLNTGGPGNNFRLSASIRRATESGDFIEWFKSFKWPWYFRSLEDYKSFLLANGFTIIHALELRHEVEFQRGEYRGWIAHAALPAFTSHLPRDVAQRFTEAVIEDFETTACVARDRWREQFVRVEIGARRAAHE